MELVRDVKLFQCDVKSADGSVIPSDSVREYLNSEEYKSSNDHNMILGGVTHKDRSGDKNYNNIGLDDPSLVNKNVTHRLNDLRLVNGWVVGKLTIFDPDLFTGEVQENITFIQGLIKSGVDLYGSVVIEGDWNSDNKLVKIARIIGWDITLNPAFKGAGIN